MACGPGAALSHLSAAELWRLTRQAGGPIHVTVPRKAGLGKRPGLVIHRTSLAPADVIKLDGIPVTSIPRTLIDLAGTEPRRTVERAIDEAQFLGRYQHRAIARALTRNAGRNGAGALKAILARHRPGSTRTRSKLEERVLCLFRGRRFSVPEVNADCDGYLVDFLWREERVVVEIDSRAAHEKDSSFERDRERDLELRAKSYEVLRFAEEHVDERRDWLLDHVARALAQSTSR
jgi:very-short-patch-repair endonuclease